GERLRTDQAFYILLQTAAFTSFNYRRRRPLSKFPVAVLRRRTIMKRTLITVAATLVLSGALFAQRVPAGPSDRGPRNPGAGRRNALGLNDAQVTAIQALAETEK